MIRTISHSITNDKGAARNVIIEPVLTQSANDGLNPTGVYTLYNDGNEGEYHLMDFQEIAPEIGDSNPLIDDKKNPDFLGRIVFKNNNTDWEYTGGSLSADEQNQLITFIKNSDSQ